MLTGALDFELVWALHPPLLFGGFVGLVRVDRIILKKPRAEQLELVPASPTRGSKLAQQPRRCANPSNVLGDVVGVGATIGGICERIAHVVGRYKP